MQQIAGLDWTGLGWTGMDWQDSSTTMEHACSRIQSYISKQLLPEAPGMLQTCSILIEEKSHIMHVPFDLSLAVKTCRATSRQYGSRCTAKLTEVTGSSQVVALLLLRG